MFAYGALSAARFLYCKPAGLYSMKELINEIAAKDL
jgi:dihydrodipicolinate reductase